jgi:hypothetical protein
MIENLISNLGILVGRVADLFENVIGNVSGVIGELSSNVF